MADIVDAVMQGFLSRLQGVPLEVSAAVEIAIRQEWGGSETGYVRKKLSPQTRMSLVANGLQQRLSLADTFKRAGIRRSTGYEMLKVKLKN